MGEPLVRGADLLDPVCGECDHVEGSHGFAGCRSGRFIVGDVACDCKRTHHDVHLAHVDSIVRREVAKALLNLPVTLEAAVRDSGKPGVLIAARAGITPKHLSQMLTGKACRVDTWTKVLHAALTEEEDR